MSYTNNDLKSIRRRKIMEWILLDSSLCKCFFLWNKYNFWNKCETWRWFWSFDWCCLNFELIDCLFWGGEDLNSLIICMNSSDCSFNKRDPHNCCPAYDFAFDLDSFVDMVVGLAVFVALRTRTYFVDDAITFWPDRMAWDLTRRNHDLRQHRHRFGLLDPIATAYRANHNLADLSHTLSVCLLLFAYDSKAIQFWNNIRAPGHRAKPKEK